MEMTKDAERVREGAPTCQGGVAAHLPCQGGLLSLDLRGLGELLIGVQCDGAGSFELKIVSQHVGQQAQAPHRLVCRWPGLHATAVSRIHIYTAFLA